MRSDDEESADATDDETEVEGAKPKPPLGNIGPRVLTWARAERWDTGLADHVPSRKRTRVGSMQPQVIHTAQRAEESKPPDRWALLFCVHHGRDRCFIEYRT